MRKPWVQGLRQGRAPKSLSRIASSKTIGANLKKHCDLSTLEIVAGSFVDAELRQHFSDIVYSLRIANAPGYIYTLIEHESTPGKLTPFKLLRYQVGLMKQHLDQNNALLPVIVPIRRRLCFPLASNLLFNPDSNTLQKSSITQ